MNVSPFLALCLALSFVTFLAEAAPDPSRGAFLAKKFKQLDLDADGKLTLEEAKPVELWVAGADADKDGLITLQEIEDRMRDRLAEMLQAQRGGLVGAPSPIDEKPAPMFVAADSPREEPTRLKGGDCGIGRLVPEVTLSDLEGQPRSLRELTDERVAVIALISTSCPVSKRYLPVLARLEADFAEQNVALLLIASSATDSAEALRAALQNAGIKAPALRDPEQTLLRALGVRASTDAFVIDVARTLVYRGAIDDQYGLGYSREAPRHRYLADAVAAVVGGGVPQIAATEAPGCLLDLAEPQTAALNDLTYHNRISRLVQANCLECHREGGVAPFALETYEEVTAKSGMIRKMVERGLMPPWFAAPAAAGERTPWHNDRSLAERDKADLLAWLGMGKPLGDAKDAPVPRTFPPQWAIGTPDAVLQIPSPIAVKAEGTMPYRNATVETSFGEDKWVRGLEVQPTAREVVHHILVFVQTGTQTGDARPTFEGEADERAGFFAAYVPGNNHVVYPEGFAKLLPAGAKLRFQIHYTPNGTATEDQVKIALLFAKEPPQHIVRVAGVADHQLNIPPGAPRHPETGILPVPKAVKLLAFTPHMHVRGTAFRYEAILPDGTVRTLLDVPRYDFNWQLSYRYAEPPTLPAGAKIRATGWFDNSTNNPANPDPTKMVRWGPQTYDEMLLGYVEYYFLEETPPPKTAAR